MPKRYAILVVHGVGQQRWFEQLEAIAASIYRTLEADPARPPTLELFEGGAALRRSEEPVLREAPARLRWTAPAGDSIQLVFREVQWADLDLPMTLERWLELVGWALSMSGVKLFAGNAHGPDGAKRCPPQPLSWIDRLKVRAQLFLASVLFGLLLVSFELLHFLAQRLSIRIKGLDRVRAVVYEYLGDVQLYQSWRVRAGGCLEALGYKSRVAIRRRMAQALVRTATEVEAGALDGYYVVAHSLGTVVAFNSLMESSGALAYYLTEPQWQALPPALRTRFGGGPIGAPADGPRRPPWLAPDDAIDRARLLAGCRGVVTLGSPLDKFAALWPAIVPINGEPLPQPVAWLNVADPQDVVAGTIDLFGTCGRAPGIGGLALQNVVWPDQRTFATAHTRYWEPGPDRLIERLIDWIEGRPFVPPRPRFSIATARALLAGSIALVFALLLVTGALLWNYLLGTIGLATTGWIEAAAVLLSLDVSLVLLASLLRRLREELLWRGWVP